MLEQMLILFALSLNGFSYSWFLFNYSLQIIPNPTSKPLTSKHKSDLPDTQICIKYPNFFI